METPSWIALVNLGGERIPATSTQNETRKEKRVPPVHRGPKLPSGSKAIGGNSKRRPKLRSSLEIAESRRKKKASLGTSAHSV